MLVELSYFVNTLNKVIVAVDQTSIIWQIKCKEIWFTGNVIHKKLMQL